MEDSNSANIKNFESKYTPEYMASDTFDPSELFAELEPVHKANAYKAEKVANLLQDCLIGRKDIDGLIALLAKKAQWNGDTLVFGQSCREALAAIASDRVLKRMIDCVKFGKVKPTESLRRLATLRSLAPGKCYFDKTWGYGAVRGVDTFDMRVTVDFDGKPGHSMSLEYAAEALRTVPSSHILAKRHDHPEEFAQELAKKPGRIVIDAIESFGPSSVGRLQTLLAAYGIVPEADWRSFWSRARAEFARQAAKDDLAGKGEDDGRRAVVPARRSDPITVVVKSNTGKFGDDWFAALRQKRDIRVIFDLVSDYEAYENREAARNGGKRPERSQAATEALSDRLLFAIKGAFLFPPPMFTRLVLMAQRLGIETSREELAEMLLDEDRFMEAGDKMPVGEAKEMFEFIIGTRPDAIGTLLERMEPKYRMGYSMLKQFLGTFWTKATAASEPGAYREGLEKALEARKARTGGDVSRESITLAEIRECAPAFTYQGAFVTDRALLEALQAKVRDLFLGAQASPALVAWVLRENKWEELWRWNLPSLYEMLDHAIAICEDQTAAGDDLQVKHVIHDLFSGEYVRYDKRRQEEEKKARAAARRENAGEAQAEAGASRKENEKREYAEFIGKTWLAKVFRRLGPLQQEALFMRLQNNQAMAEPRYQRMFVDTMTAINPDLESKRRSSPDAAQEQAQALYTSWRSLKNRQEEFRRLVEVDIPKNTEEIARARELGDLRENSEYQYAKDQQRILLARREEWGVALEKMHGTNFSEFKPDFSAVEMATTVTIAAADGAERTYSILGEWDNDDALGIISCESRLAKSLLGAHPGETVDIPANVGVETVTVKSVSALPPEVREWVGQPAAE